MPSTQTLNTTPMDEIPKIVANLRQTFNSDKTKPEAFRRAQLQKLLELLQNSREEINQVLMEDLRKPGVESYLGETLASKKDTIEALENLSDWMAPKSVEKPLGLIMDKVQVIREPLGVVLIIASWNFPFLLSLKLLAGALAAGNCVLIKASEISVASSNLLARLMNKYLDASCYQVVNGGVEETTLLLKQKFDHILYTGNGVVGKIVMKAAAEQLTPVTLELGGKTPGIVDATVDVAVTARRLVWSKYINAGQNCLAPDYILVVDSVHEQLVSEMKKAIVEFYGSDASKSKDYGRIVSQRHFQRVKGIFNASLTAVEDPKSTKNPEIVYGGEMDEENFYIGPTIIDHVSIHSPAMKEEVFGPILLVCSIPSMSEAISLVRSWPKPLVIYLFSQETTVIERFKVETSSGGLVVNDTLIHAALPSLPFGGIGESGFGVYNAKASFDTFSHPKAFVQRSFALPQLDQLRFPPFVGSKVEWFEKMQENTLTSRSLRRLQFFGQLFVLAIIVLFAAYLGFRFGSSSSASSGSIQEL